MAHIYPGLTEEEKQLLANILLFKKQLLLDIEVSRLFY